MGIPFNYDFGREFSILPESTPVSGKLLYKLSAFEAQSCGAEMGQELQSYGAEMLRELQGRVVKLQLLSLEPEK